MKFAYAAKTAKALLRTWEKKLEPYFLCGPEIVC